jgi:hypothetical protein
MSIFDSLRTKLSSPSNSGGHCGMGVDVEVTAYAPCKKHTRIVDGKTIPASTENCGCKPKITGHMKKRGDLSTIGLASLMQNNILYTVPTAFYDTGHTSRTTTRNSACTSPLVLGGEGATAPAVTDYHMQTWTDDTSHQIAATVNAITGWSGTSGSFTVTGSIVNSSGSDITYKEIGISVVMQTWTFLITHDTINSGSGYLVSNGGTLAVTETFTFSA